MWKRNKSTNFTKEAKELVGLLLHIYRPAGAKTFFINVKRLYSIEYRRFSIWWRRGDTLALRFHAGVDYSFI